MATDVKGFERRLRSIHKRHRKLARGQKTVINRRTGLTTMEPRRQIGVPVRGIVMGLLIFFVFKAWLLTALGAEEYATRLAVLSDGTLAEQLGAAVMQPDPASTGLALIAAQVF